MPAPVVDGKEIIGHSRLPYREERAVLDAYADQYLEVLDGCG